jgi:adenylylsulfate kinase
MIIWIIGMSGSGKTTLGKEMMKFLSLSPQPWVFIDGDAFRNVMGDDLGHTVQDRRRNAERISRLCELLDQNHVNVLACVLSLFHDNQRYNREHFSAYREIYIDVSLDKLMGRDNKKLYERAKKGEISNVVGVDIPFQPPYAPDYVLDNNADNSDHRKNAATILDHFGLMSALSYPYSSVDRLESPERYQYTAYLGDTFFDHYVQSRIDAVAYLQKENTFWRNVEFHRPHVREILSFYSDRSQKSKVALLPLQIESRKDINTSEFLTAALIRLLNRETLTALEKDIVDTLQKRFEVSKKTLRSIYAPRR